MFATTCTRDYLIGLEVLLQSLVDHNPQINIPFTIISNDLTEDHLILSRKIYNNINLIGYNDAKYFLIKEMQINNNVALGDYTKYEIFSLEAEKIIFLDSDTLILGDISELLNNNSNITAVRELYIDQFNTGVMVINKKYLNSRITQDLIDLTQIYGISEHLDQDVINLYFKDKINELPIAYNFLKTYHKTSFRSTGLAKYVKILHYNARKPWQRSRQPVSIEEGTLWLESYWFEVYTRVCALKTELNIKQDIIR